MHFTGNSQLKEYRFDPADMLVNTFGDPIHNAMSSATFQIVGFRNAVWKNLGAINASTPQERQKFLDEVRRMLEE